MTMAFGYGAGKGKDTAQGGVVALYRDRLAQGALAPDPVQENAVAVLDDLAARLRDYRPAPVAEGFGGWLDRLRFGQRSAPAAPPRGLYVWGEVGRGKSMLMDVFHQALATHAKRRVHFHVFMREVHEQLHALRRQPHTFAKDDMADPLLAVARLVAHDLWVLCLDELEVQDIGDAMIVGRLFAALTDLGVVVVTTSNRHPRDLYKDGLQREKFLPFIDLILSRLDVLHLDAARDYRLGRLKGARLYVTPLGEEADAHLKHLFDELAGGAEPHADELMVKGRRLAVPCSSGNVACFPFADLCEAPLGATDYMEIAARYQTVIVSGIPRMGADRASAARRFVTMIDVFYDHRVKLIASAAVAPEKLYEGEAGGFEFQRTVSRLIEMQAEDYLSAAHLA